MIHSIFNFWQCGMSWTNKCIFYRCVTGILAIRSFCPTCFTNHNDILFWFYSGYNTHRCKGKVKIHYYPQSKMYQKAQMVYSTMWLGRGLPSPQLVVGHIAEHLGLNRLLHRAHYFELVQTALSTSMSKKRNPALRITTPACTIYIGL